MTVIAWDGRHLAADKQTIFGSTIGQTTKIGYKRGHMYGCAGMAATGRALIEWFKSGANPKEFPKEARDKDTVLITIKHPRIIRLYEYSPVPIRIENKFWAVGSGDHLALMAMHLGKSAIEAVKLAAIYDVYCGGGVDAMSFGGGGVDYLETVRNS